MIFTKVAIPKEHGSWGFVLEPLLLSLFVAFTLEGLLLALATFFLFLSNQPLKIAANKSSSKKFKSTGVAVFSFYFLVALMLLVLPVTNLKFNELLVFSVALLLMPIYLFAVLKKHSRNLFVELLPIFSMTLIGVAIVMIDNSFSFSPIVFGVLLLSRAIPTVIYIVAKVKETKGFDFSALPTHTLNIGFSLFVIYASLTGLLPSLSILGAILLTARSAIGFSKFSFAKTIKQIGVMEFIYGSLFVLINGIAFLI